MKIALLGYGNMGLELERLLENFPNHSIVSISYKNKADKLDKAGIKKADVAIDFTSPEIVIENIKEVLTLGKKIVVGTTGWYDNLDQVKKLVEKNQGGLIFAKNFSIGANIFFKIVSYSSELFNKYEGYDVYGLETHHRGKKDSPSGTAKKIADLIISASKNKKTATFEKLDRQIRDDELHFASLRGGNNAGLHEVIFDSIADEIKLSHQAHNRRGFAQGALLAAEFIINKKGFWAFEDLFEKGKI